MSTGQWHTIWWIVLWFGVLAVFVAFVLTILHRGER